ncbi:GNAT family N-acetyltransferase [Leifsonia xyli]|uniref:GNAT family N-acetyltransferase n=1 Tax=Leifsonia xyli TaxID=1575 RepID=UPI003D6731B5
MRLPIPDALGTPEAAAFEELNGVLNGIVVDLWGDEDFVETAEQALAAYREQEYTERIVFVAIEEGAIVGRVEAIFPLDEDSETVSLLVDVVPALRGRGIGTALLEKGEELAADGGRRVISTYTEHPIRTLEGADRLVRAPAGTAGLPASRATCASPCTTATRSARSSGRVSCTCRCPLRWRPV